MSRPSLLDLYQAHTGKVSDKWEAYFPVYDRIFAAVRDAPVAMLEIGVQNGGSLDLWSRYFPAAVVIIGCDIDQRCAALQYDDPRIDIVAADANSDAAFNEVRSLSPAYDIIIDDGSHRSPDIIASFLRYFPLLKPGGMFVIEDLHCAYWPKFGGGIRNPRSAMAFLKALADLVNIEFWSEQLPASEPLAGFLRAEEQPAFLSDGTIDSIEFANSMAVLRRAVRPHRLGRRVIVGEQALVFPAILDEARGR